MRKSIAQKKAQEVDAVHGQAKSSPPAPKTPKAHPIAAATACVPFAAIWYVCKNVLPGYSFTALVCLCIIGIILFYGFIGEYWSNF